VSRKQAAPGDSNFKMNGFGSPYGQPAAAWQEHHTPDGRVYYYNPTTKATQWTKPEEMMSSAEVGV
jgi:pre-mRNA-processing factor 40